MFTPGQLQELQGMMIQLNTTTVLTLLPQNPTTASTPKNPTLGPTVRHRAANTTQVPGPQVHQGQKGQQAPGTQWTYGAEGWTWSGTSWSWRDWGTS